MVMSFDRIRRRFSILSLAFLSLAAAFAVAPPAAHAQGVPQKTFGDWQERCDQGPGAPKPSCGLVQTVTAEDRENIGLSVIVLKTMDGKARILRVVAPLGVLLPSGLGLKVDDAQIGNVLFSRCLANGCFAEVPIDDALLAKLSAGKTATFYIFQAPEEGIGIPISLNGFKDGFQALP